MHIEQTSDDELLAGFAAGTLDARAFHHADHVRTAFLYLRRYPPLEAVERFSLSLKHLARASGKAEIYHETITWALMFLIHERMASADGESTWAEFAAGNADLLNWKESILKKYYRAQTLASPLARRVFVMPDFAEREN